MKKFWLFVVLAFVLRLILAFGPYHPDLGNHLDWGIKFWQLGPKNFYENLFWQVSWANQPPGTIYLFALAKKIYDIFFGFFWWINVNVPLFPSFFIPFLQDKLHIFLVKLPSILADMGIAYLVYQFVSRLKSKRVGQIAALVFLFNPVIFYNSAVWGQTDAIINFFALLSFYLLWKKRFFWSVLAFFTSFYFKGSLLIFLPVFLIYFLKSELTWWKMIVYLVVQPVFFAYLSWPFVRWMTPIPWLYHLYRDRVFGHQGNMLTANAFNLWAFLFGIDFSLDDLGLFLGLTLKKWGVLISGFLILPILLKLALKKIDIKIIFGSLVLVSFACFLFLTNMHERYLYPAILYLTILIFLFAGLKRFYWLLSAVFLLNLYHLFYVPRIKFIQAVYNSLTIKLFSIVNIGTFFFFFYFFFRFFKSKKV